MFTPAVSQKRRPKILIFGDSGVGKTTLALQFPAPAVIDTEGGTNLYGGKFQFDVVSTTDWDTAYRAVEELAKGGKHKTLVIDPITILWDALQSKWNAVFLKRKPGAAGNKQEFFELGPREWSTIKEENKRFMRNLIALDMGVICTAREKPKYADGIAMKVVGETFDGEKSLPYWFDMVIRLVQRVENGKVVRKAIAIKDRTNLLPSGEFDANVDVFHKAFGDTLTAAPKPVALEPLVVPDATPQEIALSGPPSPGGGAGVAMPSQPPVPPGPVASNIDGVALLAASTGTRPPTPGGEQVEEFVKLIGPAGLNLSSEEVDKALARYGVKQFDTLDSKRADMVLIALRKAVVKKHSV